MTARRGEGSAAAAPIRSGEYVEPAAASAELVLQEIAFGAALGATTRMVPPSLTEFLR